MKGLIAAAGLCTRLQDLCEHRNKVLLDLGGETILGTILHHLEQAGIAKIFVIAGFDAAAVRNSCKRQVTWIPNPLYEHHVILGSIWPTRPLFEGRPFEFRPRRPLLCLAPQFGPPADRGRLPV